MSRKAVEARLTLSKGSPLTKAERDFVEVIHAFVGSKVPFAFMAAAVSAVEATLQVSDCTPVFPRISNDATKTQATPAPTTPTPMKTRRAKPKAS